MANGLPRESFRHYTGLGQRILVELNPNILVRDAIRMDPKVVLNPYLADQGEARGCSTNTSVIQSFSLSVIQSCFVKISFWRRHALTVADGAFSHKIDYVTIFKKILNPEEHPNRKTGLKATAIFLNGWILPLGGASSGRVCACSLRSQLVTFDSLICYRDQMILCIKQISEGWKV